MGGLTEGYRETPLRDAIIAGGRAYKSSWDDLLQGRVGSSREDEVLVEEPEAPDLSRDEFESYRRNRLDPGQTSSEGGEPEAPGSNLRDSVLSRGLETGLTLLDSFRHYQQNVQGDRERRRQAAEREAMEHRIRSAHGFEAGADISDRDIGETRGGAITRQFSERDGQPITRYDTQQGFVEFQGTPAPGGGFSGHQTDAQAQQAYMQQHGISDPRDIPRDAYGNMRSPEALMLEERDRERQRQQRLDAADPNIAAKLEGEHQRGLMDHQQREVALRNEQDNAARRAAIEATELAFSGALTEARVTEAIANAARHGNTVLKENFDMLSQGLDQLDLTAEQRSSLNIITFQLASVLAAQSVGTGMFPNENGELEFMEADPNDPDSVVRMGASEAATIQTLAEQTEAIVQGAPQRDPRTPAQIQQAEQQNYREVVQPGIATAINAGVVGEDGQTWALNIPALMKDGELDLKAVEDDIRVSFQTSPDIRAMFGLPENMNQWTPDQTLTAVEFYKQARAYDRDGVKRRFRSDRPGVNTVGTLVADLRSVLPATFTVINPMDPSETLTLEQVHAVRDKLLVESPELVQDYPELQGSDTMSILKALWDAAEKEPSEYVPN